MSILGTTIPSIKWLNKIEADSRTFGKKEDFPSKIL